MDDLGQYKHLLEELVEVSKSLIIVDRCRAEGAELRIMQVLLTLIHSLAGGYEPRCPPQ